MRYASWLVAGTLSMLACAPREPAQAPSDGQSYAVAVGLICTVDARLDADVRADPLALPRARWERVRAEVKHPDGIYLRTLLEAKAPAEQRALLAAEAAVVGLASCPLAVTLEREAVE